MRFAVATAAVAGLAGVAVADGGWGNHEGSWGSSAAPNATATATAGEVWVTDVVTAFTTYCPYATQLTHGGSTYTVSSATTLTITNCPCTITRPASSSVVTSCSTCAWTGSWGSSSESSASAATESSSVWASQSWSSESASVSPVTTSASSSAVWTSPVSPITTSAPYPSGNATWTATASSYSTSSSPAAATYTGAASQLSVGGGLLALFGLVAAL